MAVVEYKHHVFLGDHRRHIPGWIMGADNWYNPANHTYVGWVKDNPDFYVPWDTLKTLTKEDLVQRCLGIHNANPFKETLTNNQNVEELRNLNDSEVRTLVEEWYDNFVSIHSSL